jgi:hypothetical protein
MRGNLTRFAVAKTVANRGEHGANDRVGAGAVASEALRNQSEEVIVRHGDDSA